MTAPESAIHILKPGRFRSGGRDVALAESDLAAIASAYDPSLHEAPIVIGHPRVDAPAYGWVEGVRSSPKGLHAVPRQLEASFAEMVRDGRFKKISASLYGPGHANNPKPDGWYLRHVGFLGAQPPVVKGLDPIQLADEEGDVATVELDLAEMSPYVLRSVASLFRGIREYLISQSGLDAADRTMPDWEIENVETEAGLMANPAPSPSFSEPAAPAPTEPGADPVTGTAAADLAARETSLAERETAIEARERTLADAAKTALKADAVAFAEGLVSEGKILPREKDSIVGVLLGIPKDTSVEFAEDADATPAPTPARTFLRTFLGALPVRVDFSERSPAPDPGASSSRSFRVPHTHVVAPENADLHRRALELSERADIDYDTAVMRIARGEG